MPLRLVAIAAGIGIFYRGWLKTQRRVNNNVAVITDLMKDLIGKYMQDCYVT